MDQFVTNDVQGTFRVDSLASSHPLYVPVQHPDEINEIFDSISYGKVRGHCQSSLRKHNFVTFLISSSGSWQMSCVRVPRFVSDWWQEAHSTLFHRQALVYCESKQLHIYLHSIYGVICFFHKPDSESNALMMLQTSEPVRQVSLVLATDCRFISISILSLVNLVHTY